MQPTFSSRLFFNSFWRGQKAVSNFYQTPQNYQMRFWPSNHNMKEGLISQKSNTSWRLIRRLKSTRLKFRKHREATYNSCKRNQEVSCSNFSLIIITVIVVVIIIIFFFFQVRYPILSLHCVTFLSFVCGQGEAIQVYVSLLHQVGWFPHEQTYLHAMK